jgi:hypothetical protein
MNNRRRLEMQVEALRSRLTTCPLEDFDRVKAEFHAAEGRLMTEKAADLPAGYCRACFVAGRGAQMRRFRYVSREEFRRVTGEESRVAPQYPNVPLYDCPTCGADCSNRPAKPAATPARARRSARARL